MLTYCFPCARTNQWQCCVASACLQHDARPAQPRALHSQMPCTTKCRAQPRAVHCLTPTSGQHSPRVVYLMRRILSCTCRSCRLPPGAPFVAQSIYCSGSEATLAECAVQLYDPAEDDVVHCLSPLITRPLTVYEECLKNQPEALADYCGENYYDYGGFVSDYVQGFMPEGMVVGVVCAEAGPKSPPPPVPPPRPPAPLQPPLPPPPPRVPPSPK